MSVAVGIFHGVFGRFYTARNPVQFWAKWNPSRHRMALQLYKGLRKQVGFPISVPFTIAVFVFWGITDDLLWAVIELVSHREIFPFGFWTFSLSAQCLVVLAWKQLPSWSPRLPSALAIPATQLYIFASFGLLLRVYPF